MLAHQQRTPEKGIGRSGQSYELCTLTGIKIELCQAQSRKGSYQKCRIGQNTLQGHEQLGAMSLMHHPEEHGTGSHAKGDHIRQRIQLLAYGRRYSKRTGCETIKEVKHGTADNHDDGPMKMTIECGSCGCTSTQEIATGDCIGKLTYNDVWHLQDIYIREL